MVATALINIPVRNRVRNSLVALLLIMAVGGHWALLQAVAWTGMVIRFSQTETVAAAVSKTFDGLHPCGLCKAIDHGKKAEKKEQLQKTELKVPWILSTLAQPILPLLDASPEAHPDERNALLFESPPIPPPRSA